MQLRYGYVIRALTEGLNSTLPFNCTPREAGREAQDGWRACWLGLISRLLGFNALVLLLGSHTPWQIIWQLARSTFGRQYSSCSSFVLDDFEETVSSWRLADIGSDWRCTAWFTMTG